MDPNGPDTKDGPGVGVLAWDLGDLSAIPSFDRLPGQP